MNPYKVVWALRALLYKVILGKFSFPGYFGRPIFLLNAKQIFFGRRVRIYPGARLEVLDKNSSIEIEDNVSIGQSLHVVSRGRLVIGKNTTISGNVLITNVDHQYGAVGEHIMDQPLTEKRTHVGENCFLGYGVVLQAGTILGNNCIVGSNSVLKGEFPDSCVIAGAPAKIIKKYEYSTGQWKRYKDDC